MKKIILFSFLGLLFFLYPLPAVHSEPNDDQELKEESHDVDHEAQEHDGQQKVTDRLKSQFNVSDQRIQSLRDQKLGYGEIGIVLALAKQMPGGINDTNVNKIMDMRQNGDKHGWGNIAKSLNLNLGEVRSQINHIHPTSSEKSSTNTETQIHSDHGNNPSHSTMNMGQHSSMGRSGK